MALRSLDNVLPIPVLTTPEDRLKKNPQKTKIVTTTTITSLSSSNKPTHLVDVVNDENKAPIIIQPSAPTEVTIDYIPSVNLNPFPDPDIKILGLVEDLESKDWLKVCDSLNTTRRIALYHSHLLLPLLEKVMLVLVKAMKNPRSALIKTSIMASSDIFTAYGDKILPTESTTSDAFDHLLLQLLLKASQDKKFVCEEAEKALNAMVESITPLFMTHKLRAYVTHSNPRIRAKAAVFMSTCASKMGIEGMKEFGLVSLIQLGADLLNDRLPEAREAARSIVGSVYGAVIESEEEKHDAWQVFCQANLSAVNAQSIVKLVLSTQ